MKTTEIKHFTKLIKIHLDAIKARCVRILDSNESVQETSKWIKNDLTGAFNYLEELEKLAEKETEKLSL